MLVIMDSYSKENKIKLKNKKTFASPPKFSHGLYLGKVIKLQFTSEKHQRQTKFCIGHMR